MSNLYHHGQAQLHSMHRHLQAAQNEIGNTQRQVAATEQELQREREGHELLHQQFAELQECHFKLLKEYEGSERLCEDLRRSAQDSKTFADEVARRVEGLVNSPQTRLAGGKAGELDNEQSISAMILESAKNALLVEAISGQHSEDEHFTKLKHVMDKNVKLQQRNMALSKQIETLSQQVEEGKNELASLNKALELAAEGGRRKKPRRGKMSASKG
jgi:chromosome segregation ATPase